MEAEQLTQILLMLVGAVVIEGISLTILTYLVLISKGEPPVIEEVFTVYSDGRLINHISKGDEEHTDNDIFTSMLTVVQDFIKDSFSNRESSGVKKIEFGKKRIYFERGKHIYLAVVYTGDANDKMEGEIIGSIDAIELKFSDVLEDWDGEIEKIDKVGEIVCPLLGPVKHKSFTFSRSMRNNKKHAIS